MESIETKLNKQTTYLRAITMLLTRNYDASGGERIELLLASSGLGYQDIAEILGKKPDAVRMLLKRSKPPKNI